MSRCVVFVFVLFSSTAGGGVSGGGVKRTSS